MIKTKPTSFSLFIKGFFTFLLIFSLHPVAEAQQQEVSLTGHLLDASDNSPLTGASISVLAPADSSLITGTIADENGRFSISGLPPQPLLIRFSYIGYQTRFKSTAEFAGQSQISFDTILLQRSGDEMDELTVTGERMDISFERDRTVYRTENLVSAQGGSAIEVLEELPSIEVDVMGTISYRGNQNVVIHINGRPTPMRGDALEAFLRGIPADMIDRIETIPNPSARHDPEGIGGIINIVMKEDRDAGISGRLALNGGTQRMLRPNAAIGYHTNRWSIFGSYAFGMGDFEMIQSEERNQFGSQSFLLDRETNSNFESQNQMISIDAEYTTTGGSTFSLSNQSVYFGNDQLTLSTGRHTGNGFLPDYDMRSEYDRSGIFFNNILGFKHNWGRNHKVSTEAKAEFFDFGYDSFQIQQYSDDTVSDISHDAESVVFNAGIKTDYERPLTDAINLESGAEVEWRSNQHDITQQNARSEWEYDLEIYSAYAILNSNFGKFSLEGGTRVEQVFTSLNSNDHGGSVSFDNDYFNFFPSFSAGYSISQAKQLSLSYSKRINRPQIEAFVTNIPQDDPLFRRTGNPALLPEITHSFEFAFSRFSQRSMLTIQPYFRHTRDVIRRNVEVTEDGVTEYSYRNLDSRNNYGTELTGSYSFTPALRLNSSVNLYLTEIDGTNTETNLDSGAFAWNANTSVSYTFGFGLMAMINGRYSSPVDVEYGKVSGQGSLDIALRKGFMSNQLMVGVHASDVFDTMKNEYRFNADSFSQLATTDYSSRRVMFSVSWNFGNRRVPETPPAQPPSI